MSIINSRSLSGNKIADDVKRYFYNRIKGKKGILQKQLKLTRTINTMKCVKSSIKIPLNPLMSTTVWDVYHHAE